MPKDNELYINQDGLTESSLADIYAGPLRDALVYDRRNEEPGLRVLQSDLRALFDASSVQKPELLDPQKYGNKGKVAHKIATNVNTVISRHQAPSAPKV